MVLLTSIRFQITAESGAPIKSLRLRLPTSILAELKREIRARPFYLLGSKIHRYFRSLTRSSLPGFSRDFIGNGPALEVYNSRSIYRVHER